LDDAEKDLNNMKKKLESEMDERSLLEKKINELKSSINTLESDIGTMNKKINVQHQQLSN